MQKSWNHSDYNAFILVSTWPHGLSNETNAYSDLPMPLVHLLYYLEYLWIRFFHTFLWRVTSENVGTLIS